MPKDIRSYFISNNPSNKKEASTSKRKRRAISSDEEEKKTDSPKKRSKLVKKPEVVHILSDSDNDENDVQHSKKAKHSSIVSPKKKTPPKKKSSPKKVVSLADAFGKSPIIRVEAPQITKRIQKLEAEFHDDKEFEETLKQLDTSQIEEDHLTENETKPSGSKDKKNNETDTENKTSSIKSPAKSSPVKSSPTKSSPAKSLIAKKHDVPEKRKNASSSSTEDSSPKKMLPKEKPKKANLKTSSKRKTNIEIEHKINQKKDSPTKPAMDIFEERIEKKKQSAALYQQYLQRGGARNPGSKKIPEGAANCLAGLSFLVTGILESLEREEADELIKKYGGRILQQVSRKTDYVIVGDQPGPAKLAKAESLNIKKISEDDLLELIATRPAGKATDIKQSRGKSMDRKVHKSSESDDAEPMKIESEPTTSADENTKKVKLEERSEIIKQYEPDTKDKIEKLSEETNGSHEITRSAESEALTEKYRPKSMKQIIGQQGEKSNAVKLYNWLKNWHKNHKGETKSKRPGPWDKNSDGSFFRAALLSGPPGIGKTTTVQVVCDQLGFDLLEFNASDTRSKKLLKEEVTEIMSNRTMKSYFTDTRAKPSANHVLLMDEVDGMAGNEDRGGLQELVSMIKVTDIPIICICNDRSNPKMRTLANYTYDLRFPKPRLEQIRGAMLSMCFKENIKISTEDLDRLIESTDQDIRQVINHLTLYLYKPGHQEKTNKKHVNKDVPLGPWDVVKNVFSAAEHKTMTIDDKCDLFFHDYSIAPLFVQENYLSVMPNAPRDELMERIASSAESLALGDIVERAIRNESSWSLLPLQAFFSSVIPGAHMSGHITSQINFPSWLGRNSKSNKFDRLRQELATHGRLTTGAGKEAMNLDYAPYLRDAIIKPLITHGTEGVDTAVSIMNNYHLIREDLDALVEITMWPSQRDIMQDVDSKVKAAFTRAYNKNSPAVPYAISGTSTKKRGAQASQDEGFIDDEEEVNPDSDENEDDLNTDRMIKAKKPSVSKKAEPKAKGKEKPAKRGRGRGRGK